jgi:hypothetical protein
MEKEKIEQGLMKMGYRTLKPGIWAKPVAFHLFLFEMDKMLWTNFFKGNNGQMLVWNTETYKQKDWEVDGKDEFLLFLKYTEQYARIDTRNVDSEFEFMTDQEIYSLIL